MTQQEIKDRIQEITQLAQDRQQELGELSREHERLRNDLNELINSEADTQLADMEGKFIKVKNTQQTMRGKQNDAGVLTYTKNEDSDDYTLEYYLISVTEQRDDQEISTVVVATPHTANADMIKMFVSPHNNDSVEEINEQDFVDTKDNVIYLHDTTVNTNLILNFDIEDSEENDVS